MGYRTYLEDLARKNNQDNKGDSRKADWQKEHNCYHCHKKTKSLLCEHCGKLSLLNV